MKYKNYFLRKDKKINTKYTHNLHPISVGVKSIG